MTKMYIHVIYVCFHKWTEQKQLLGEFKKRIHTEVHIVLPPPRSR